MYILSLPVGGTLKKMCSLRSRHKCVPPQKYEFGKAYASGRGFGHFIIESMMDLPTNTASPSDALPYK